MTTRNQYCLIRPLYGLIKFPRQQMCERPVGVECPTLGIVGAEFDRLAEERHGFSEAPFVGKRISKTAMDNRQIGIELDGCLQFGQCVGVGSARNQRAPVYETERASWSSSSTACLAIATTSWSRPSSGSASKYVMP